MAAVRNRLLAALIIMVTLTSTVNASIVAFSGDVKLCGRPVRGVRVVAADCFSEEPYQPSVVTDWKGTWRIINWCFCCANATKTCSFRVDTSVELPANSSFDPNKSVYVTPSTLREIGESVTPNCTCHPDYTCATRFYTGYPSISLELQPADGHTCDLLPPVPTPSPAAPSPAPPSPLPPAPNPPSPLPAPLPPSNHSPTPPPPSVQPITSPPSPPPVRSIYKFTGIMECCGRPIVNASVVATGCSEGPAPLQTRTDQQGRWQLSSSTFCAAAQDTKCSFALGSGMGTMVPAACHRRLLSPSVIVERSSDAPKFLTQEPPGVCSCSASGTAGCEGKSASYPEIISLQLQPKQNKCPDPPPPPTPPRPPSPPPRRRLKPSPPPPQPPSPLPPPPPPPSPLPRQSPPASSPPPPPPRQASPSPPPPRPPSPLQRQPPSPTPPLSIPPPPPRPAAPSPPLPSPPLSREPPSGFRPLEQPPPRSKPADPSMPGTNDTSPPGPSHSDSRPSLPPQPPNSRAGSEPPVGTPTGQCVPSPAAEGLCPASTSMDDSDFEISVVECGTKRAAVTVRVRLATKTCQPLDWVSLVGGDTCSVHNNVKQGDELYIAELPCESTLKVYTSDKTFAGGDMAITNTAALGEQVPVSCRPGNTSISCGPYPPAGFLVSCKCDLEQQQNVKATTTGESFGPLPVAVPPAATHGTPAIAIALGVAFASAAIAAAAAGVVIMRRRTRVTFVGATGGHGNRVSPMSPVRSPHPYREGGAWQQTP